MKKVIIVGGGAAGIFAAINLKKELKDKVDVTILEAQNRIGKKLLVTGNGKCNLSNVNISPNDYNHWSVKEALNVFDYKKLVDYFYNLGLMTRCDDAGRLYPYSERATTVLDVLRSRLDLEEVKVICDFNVNHIKSGQQFLVYSADYRLLLSDYVIIATGGMSSISFDYKAYSLFTYFGHTLTPLRPGLVALKTKENVKSLSGLRFKAKVSVFSNEIKVYETIGEVLFKDYGLSGIAIFEASRFYSPGCTISLDLAYDKEKSELRNFLKIAKTEAEGLSGLFPKMIAQEIISRGGDAVDTIKDFRFTVVDTYGFDSSQITVGGISHKEFSPFTYESSLVNNLYGVGEVLDIDGTSGGFNLHFAWASSYVASCDIINKIKKEEKDNEKRTNQ